MNNEKYFQLYTVAVALSKSWFVSMNIEAPGAVQYDDQILDEIMHQVDLKGVDDRLFNEENRGGLYACVLMSLRHKKDAVDRPARIQNHSRSGRHDDDDDAAQAWFERQVFKAGAFNFDNHFVDDDGDDDGDDDDGDEDDVNSYNLQEEDAGDRAELLNDYVEQLRICQGERIANMAGEAFGLTCRSGRSMISESRRAICEKIIAKAAKAVGMSTDELNKLKEQYSPTGLSARELKKLNKQPQLEAA